MIKCSKRKLCRRDECENNCLKRSFASQEKSKYWNKELNGDISPKDVLKSSHKKFYFDCDKCNHIFQINLNNITNSNSWCQFCSNKFLCKDEKCQICFSKSFASHEKSTYWDYKMNDVIVPRQFFKSSGKEFYFNCDKCYHIFKISLKNITLKNIWCLYCSNSLLCESNCNICFEKSFLSNEKSEFWNYKLNNKIKPSQVFKFSHKKYFFNCSTCNHQFDVRLYCISMNNTWCPYCCIPVQKICDDVTCNLCFVKSFSSHEKSKYWNYDKNKGVIPRNVIKGSTNKYYFNCNLCYHEFETSLSSITYMKSWCPFCKNVKLCESKECKDCYIKSFASHPKSKLLSDININSRNIFKSSHKKYSFQCDTCNNNFEMGLNQIVNQQQWCPICAYSKLEKYTKKFLDKLEIKFKSQKKYDNLKNKRCLPFDFYIPELKLLLELDGIQHFKCDNYFHKNKKKIFKKRIITDIKKNFYAISNGYNFVRISYLELPFLERYLEYVINKIKSRDTQFIYFSNIKLYRKTYLFNMF